MDLAAAPEEKGALDMRYQVQVARATAAGETVALSELEAIASTSSACKGMSRWDIDRLLSSDCATAATYYQQINGKCRIPDDNRWDRLRRIADASFFQCFGEDIHFAALSTDGNWLQNYGDGAVFFKDSMIAHRATVFEQNTAAWVDETNGNLTIPPGFRSLWEERHHLAVAKLGEAACDDAPNLGALLLCSGANTAEDRFMEVHICGGFTARSTSAVVVKGGALGYLARAAAIERGAKLGISFSELP